jgi:hypothetical protein
MRIKAMDSIDQAIWYALSGGDRRVVIVTGLPEFMPVFDRIRRMVAQEGIIYTRRWHGPQVHSFGVTGKIQGIFLCNELADPPDVLVGRLVYVGVTEGRYRQRFRACAKDGCRVLGGEREDAA